MKTYIATIAHDRGIIQLEVTAKSKARAAAMVMAAEHCPSYAILSMKAK